MKIIFLDIDGVMNYPCIQKAYKIKYGIGEMCLKRIDLLNQYTKTTNAKIVISSTWRKDTRQGSIQEYISKFGVTGDIIGETPVMDYAFRGNEIKKWLRNNEDIIGCEEYSFKDYVILDDDSDMLFWQKDNFIKVDRWVGITPTTLHMMDKIFGIKTKINYEYFVNN